MREAFTKAAAARQEVALRLHDAKPLNRDTRVERAVFIIINYSLKSGCRHWNKIVIASIL